MRSCDTCLFWLSGKNFCSIFGGVFIGARLLFTMRLLSLDPSSINYNLDIKPVT